MATLAERLTQARRKLRREKLATVHQNVSLSILDLDVQILRIEEEINELRRKNHETRTRQGSPDR